MHRIAAIPGGWQPDSEGVIFIEQSAAPIVFLTAKDTDIQTLAQVVPQLPEDFPQLRVVNLLQLQQQLTIDTYAEEVLEAAQVIIIRLLGGRSYWSYGLEVVQETIERTGATLFVLPGDDRPDPDLLTSSTVALELVNQLWRYLIEEGVDNFCHALQFVADIALGGSYSPPSPRIVPRVGVYERVCVETKEKREKREREREGEDDKFLGSGCVSPIGKVGILFYRAHYLAGNIAVIDSLVMALEKRKLEAIPVFVSSLRDLEVQGEVLKQLQGIDLLLVTTGFSLAKLDSDVPVLDLWKELNVPVLQVILSGGTIEQWESQWRGLSPRDMAMNVALPEVDGRIISRAVSFKAIQKSDRFLETDIVVYQPVAQRIAFVADLSANWVNLRQTLPAQKRVALILANYPSRDGRLANGVGLDTPASCITILQALQREGYKVENIPQTGEELIKRLTTTVTNDPEGREFRQVAQSLTLAEYQQYFATLPEAVQTGISDRWNVSSSSSFPISGIQLGNIFVGIQPPRGYDLDPSLNYHAPDLEPPHAYLAFYYWLRNHFQAQAIIHVGKHGNLEWLPGKSIALSANCYPEVALGAMPHLYPFIVNDPGEGSQAKRRSQAVILDHLTPPMTRAELYGTLQQLEGLIDEYYEAESFKVYPSRLPIIQERLKTLLIEANLEQDLSLEKQKLTKNKELFTEIITKLDGYLCELKEAQIRDGLHIFGQYPQGKQLRDLVVAISRCPGKSHQGLTRAIAQDWGLDLDPLTADPTQLAPKHTLLKGCRHVGDVIELLEEGAANLVEEIIINRNFTGEHLGEEQQQELTWLSNHLLPLIYQTEEEITNLLRGLAGEYIPSGASGAPTRGRPEVLPTGRNFYSVDIRAIPTETAWDVGRRAAELLVERYTQENGEYPQTLGFISVGNIYHANWWR